MIEYRTFTLGDLIDELNGLGVATVKGLGLEIDSYRGYYERNAIEPSPGVILPAATLAREYENQIGKEITGYKGGDYYVSANENVYLAGYGDTGPNIAGFVKDEDGDYVPVVVRVNEW